MRMQPEVGSRSEGSDAVKRNSLNMLCCRTFSVKYHMLSWHLKGKRGKPRMTVLDNLSVWQKEHNTTRGSTPGLINPALGDFPGNRVHPPQSNEKQGVRVPGGRQYKRKFEPVENDLRQPQANKNHGEPTRAKKKQRNNEDPAASGRTINTANAFTDGVEGDTMELETDNVLTGAANSRPRHRPRGGV
ncbi:MAG: hypothetical protein Q9163_001299 [Psora crenata]